MADGINPISMAMSEIAYTNTSISLYHLSDTTARRLEEYGVKSSEVKSEQEAQEVIKEKEAEKSKEVSQKNGETYYEKQIISDAIDLAKDLGLSVSQDTKVSVIMDNIAFRLLELENQLGHNENTRKVVDEYSNRFDYIYAQYMNKADTLKKEIVTSLDLMGVKGSAYTTL